MTSHTPGPFFADGAVICAKGTEIDVEGYTIAHCHDVNSHGRFSRFVTREEREANLRLFVAAPKMLAFVRSRAGGPHELSCPRRRDDHSFCNCPVEKAVDIIKTVEGRL